jgi:hypothetical protein
MTDTGHVTFHRKRCIVHLGPYETREQAVRDAEAIMVVFVECGVKGNYRVEGRYEEKDWVIAVRWTNMAAVSYGEGEWPVLSIWQTEVKGINK